MDFISFKGEAPTFSEAEMVARFKMWEWMRIVDLKRADVVQFAMQTVAIPCDQGQSWTHLITMLVSTRQELDGNLLNRLGSRIKTQADVDSYVAENWPDLVPLAPKAPEPPRTETEERALIRSNNARAQRAGIFGELTYEEWMGLCSCFGGVCLCCGAAGRLSIDHVQPVTKNGTNLISNIQPLCRSCNSSKSDKNRDYRDPLKLALFLRSLETPPLYG